LNIKHQAKGRDEKRYITDRVEVAGAFSRQKVPEPGRSHVEGVYNLHVEMPPKRRQPLRMQHQFFLLPLQKDLVNVINIFLAHFDGDLCILKLRFCSKVSICNLLRHILHFLTPKYLKKSS
jgi:hypothetical protein